MSLLLDALKRAEQEKLAKQQADLPAPSAKEPAPAAAAPASASILELQPLGRPAAAGPAKNDAQTAQTLFAAKAAGNAAPGSRAALLWSLAALVVLVLAGGGGYLWYSLNSLAPRTALRPPVPLPPSNRAIAPAPASAEATLATTMPALAASSTGSAIPPAPVATAPAPAASPAPTARSAAESRDDMLVRMVCEAASAENAPVKLSRSTEAPRVSPAIAIGYQALVSGQLAEARRAYSAAVASDPTSADAALGLATVEARSGNIPAATALYRKTLELDSRNATALAGLASMTEFTRPDAVETQLRGEIARYPQSAALLVALGNLYAQQARWTEAQSAYFEAHGIEPAGADILYNLAVSLDHLGKSRVAADFYRRALESARGQPTQFDPAAAARRLGEIGP